MKTPRFEGLATAWRGDASFYIVYTREAHPRGRGYDRLAGFADEVAKMDADGDNAVALAEFRGPREMFDPFDLDHDEVIRSHELLSARRINQFDDFAEPASDDERRAAARRFRAEVPGAIPVLVDPIGEPTAHAYGGMPNSAFVIDRDGKVAAAMPWASVREVDAALVRLTGRTAMVATPTAPLEVIGPQLAAAATSRKPVLVQFSAPGCGACEKMHGEALADREVKAAMAGFELVELGVEHDANWALFEALDLATTPAFVVLESDGAVVARSQGLVGAADFLTFLRGAAASR